MPRLSAQKPPTIAMHMSWQQREVDIVKELADRMNLEFAQAIRIIINEWHEAQLKLQEQERWRAYDKPQVTAKETWAAYENPGPEIKWDLPTK